MKTSFMTTLRGLGNNTGIEVPPEKLAELQAGKRPPVTVRVNDYAYQSTVAVMNGKFMLPFAKAHREASGIAAGDDIDVTLELETGPRIVEMPESLRTALQTANLQAAFEAKSYTVRKEFARSVSDAKTDETRQRRIAKIITALQP